MGVGVNASWTRFAKSSSWSCIILHLVQETADSSPQKDESEHEAQPLQIFRRNIEYLSAVRVLSTYVGRDFGAIEREYANLKSTRRPVKAIEEYSPIDLEWLIISRVKVKVVYSTSVLHLISWLRYGSGGASRLQFAPCDDLTEALIDDTAHMTQMRHPSEKRR